MNIKNTCYQILEDLKEALEQISQATYSQAIPALFNSSIGQHTRHIIEFFQCLEAQFSAGKVCYDLRKRDYLIEQSTEDACNAIEQIQAWLELVELSEEAIDLNINYDPNSTEEIKISSSLSRELAYNIEHAIHHMAIIKIGLFLTYPELKLPAHFGVAPSTLRYQKTVEAK